MKACSWLCSCKQQLIRSTQSKDSFTRTMCTPGCLPACLLLHSFHLCVACRSLWSFMMRLIHSYKAIGISVYVFVLLACVCVYERAHDWVCTVDTSMCISCAWVLYFSELIFFRSFRCAFVLCSMHAINVQLSKCNPLFFLLSHSLLWPLGFCSCVYVCLVFNFNFSWEFGCCWCENGMFRTQLKQEEHLEFDLYTKKCTNTSNENW